MAFISTVWWGTSLSIVAALHSSRPSSNDLPPYLISREALWKARDLEGGMQLVDELLDKPPAVKEEIQARFLQVPILLKETMHGVPLSTSVPNATVCAMVSSSRQVLLAKAGRKIDSVDGPVMRFNMAETRRFEKWVGGRRDMFAVNNYPPCWWSNERYPRHPFPADDAKILLNGFYGGVSGRCLKKLLAKFPNIKLYALDFDRLNEGLLSLIDELAPDHDVMKYFSKKGTWLTTGMVGAAFLLSMCEEVRHYGFLPLREDLRADNCSQHYWDKRNRGKCSADPHHKLTAEHILWAAMSTKGEFPGEGIVRGLPRVR